MLTEFFKKLGKSKWLPWLSISPFIFVPLAIIFGGEVSRGIGFLAFFASMWAGVFLGGKFALVASKYLLKTSVDVSKRLSAAFSAFGFLFLPVLVGLFTNAYMGTDIGIQSIGTHFLSACFGAAVFFSISPENTESSG
jgi:hypothetical protein